MVGSFEIFRKYQRSLLVCVAILAMLAFFVLPPFLQVGSSMGSQDPLAVSWTGGELRENRLERTVAMRSQVNRFLMEAAAVGVQNPALVQRQLLPVGEEATVRTLLLAKEARDNGIVVSDRTVNEFLGQCTGNLVRPEQFDALLAGLRIGPAGMSQQDLFEVLRTELAARSMLQLHASGFRSDPPGWQWDYFRRLDQRATVEVVPVVVEGFAGQVPAPSEGQLRDLYTKFKDDLPQARSADPGFREPHRVQFEYLRAPGGAFVDEEMKNVTDEEIAAFYDKEKVARFRAKPPATDEKPADDAKPADAKPADAKPADAKPADAPKGATKGDSPFKAVAFKQPALAAQAPPAAPAAPATPAAPAVKPASDAAATAPAATAPAAEKPAEKAADKPAGEAAAEDPAQFEPLDKVKDDIRKELAGRRAAGRIDEIFNRVSADVSGFAEDYALWQARRPAGVAAPRPPDLAVIAEKQGLTFGKSGLVDAGQAVAEGGIGGSYEFMADPRSRFGFRQQLWRDQMFGAGGLTWRPIRSGDVQGNRYLSWKTEDQPEFTPSFELAKPVVERAWRILEGRGLARRHADEIARQAKTSPSLEAAAEAAKPSAAGKTATQAVVKVGPFSWLEAGPMAAGGEPTLSQPEALSMPGDEFMRAVFALEPGGVAVAFNEPRTVCYVIRLVEFDPSTATLQEKFLEARGDRRRIGMVAERETSQAFRGLLESMDKRNRLEWKRPPRVSREGNE